MIEYAKLYKDISLEIIDILNKEKLDELDELLNQRQYILDKENNIDELKKILIADGILDIDKKIYVLLSENIDKVKREIKNHRMLKQANNSYINFNKAKLNIFNEKV